MTVVGLVTGGSPLGLESVSVRLDGRRVRRVRQRSSGRSGTGRLRSSARAKASVGVGQDGRVLASGLSGGLRRSSASSVGLVAQVVRST